MKDLAVHLAWGEHIDGGCKTADDIPLHPARVRLCAGEKPGDFKDGKSNHQSLGLTTPAISSDIFRYPEPIALSRSVNLQLTKCTGIRVKLPEKDGNSFNIELKLCPRVFQSFFLSLCPLFADVSIHNAVISLPLGAGSRTHLMTSGSRGRGYWW